MNSMTRNPVCIGAGLVALDVVISGEVKIPAQFFAGGSCGNVLTILSYLGWASFPIARLSNNVAAEMLVEDLRKWNVHEDLLSITADGSTPIIIHRILKDKLGEAKHRFEFRNPEDGSYLPSYKPCLARSVADLVEKKPAPNVFYFDRINRASIDLAKAYKRNGAIIIFEPSSAKDERGFDECLQIADVIKFSNDRISTYDELYPAGQVALEIQTLGTEGLKFRRKGSPAWTSLHGYSIENVVDSAGAGDWCTAGLIMNLFRNNRAIENIETIEIAAALQFGQALSALNCTFEGARGLMYNIARSELLLFVQHIVSSEMKKIPQKNKPTIHSTLSNSIKISSLFASIHR
ncbi:MAG: hypothetical protein B7X86_07490 [Sphingobacteriales bacterium 17-39-43]|jgi:fructokinase|nr:MAG: hypothetical protein B7Y76_02025 [Sphingobacteriia bacterium 35-40-5]OYZ31795.1 MAG: hypothetical protein B7Y24_08135 [Sphingobacteriales bacterium 16-39-50]OZA24880.1 MAG: hypothetical protein B7X86_07490 [Sphingobacteriales bacterium 17-39-43]